MKLFINWFCLDNIWKTLNGVAETEGRTVGKSSGQTLEQCKALCDGNKQCHSIAFGGKDNQCYLKDKCISPSEPKKDRKNFQTYYKEEGFCRGIFVEVYVSGNR